MQFGDLAALDNFGASFGEGRVTAVVGPSGCGKSTLLRVVAGLERPATGSVTWRGSDLAAIPTHERPFGLMFQDYALFPHRSVADNVAFGLRMAGVDPAARTARVDELLSLVGLDGYQSRSVTTLSGGEQQRVALARTVAPKPELLMLDEPIGSLDRELRERLVTEMRDIFAQLGLTVVYVTHDQEEAFALAEDLIVMRRGSLVTQGPPEHLWRNPQDTFTARFLGHENVLAPTEAKTLQDAGILRTPGPLLIPSDAVTLARSDARSATVLAATLRAGRRRTEADVSGVRLVATGGRERFEPGDHVEVAVEACRVVPLTA